MTEKNEKTNEIYYSSCDSPIGKITLVCDGENLIGCYFESQKYFDPVLSEKSVKKNGIPILDAAKVWLNQYFNGEKPDISQLKLSPIGGEFRLEVWKLLCEIPYGQVTTYGAIANKMAQKMNKQRMSAQAVGGAISHNPIPIIIPCHRVVGANGSLTGFSCGLDKKIYLLEHEGVDLTKFYSPIKKYIYY